MGSTCWQNVQPQALNTVHTVRRGTAAAILGSVLVELQQMMERPVCPLFIYLTELKNAFGMSLAVEACDMRSTAEEIQPLMILPSAVCLWNSRQ